MASLQASHQAQKTSSLLRSLLAVRRRTEELIKPLDPEDLCMQGMEEASPPKWHLAHTNWFFETFLLKPYLKGYQHCDPRWDIQFNSYYEALGERYPRPQRGMLTRPNISKIMEWRTRVDTGLKELVSSSIGEQHRSVQELVELGLHHEQQHQELMLMDLLDGFSRQPMEPIYKVNANLDVQAGSASWLDCNGGLVEIGTNSEGFHFDNESPRHKIWLDSFQINSALVSNAEVAQFISDKGYQRPELWMSEGWNIIQGNKIRSPIYWRDNDCEFTLAGIRPLNPGAPARHLSWFEADAIARWSGARLPSEGEWEYSCTIHGDDIGQSHGVIWQWTASPYRPYPGFQLPKGAIGEYNGKFMSSQMVLRGSSWLTPLEHSRNTYRNFFPPASRWMAAGLRLAR